jgi:hypothetical protein
MGVQNVLEKIGNNAYQETANHPITTDLNATSLSYTLTTPNDTV